MTDPSLPVRTMPGSSAPDAGSGEPAFMTRRERRAFEQAKAQESLAELEAASAVRTEPAYSRQDHPTLARSTEPSHAVESSLVAPVQPTLQAEAEPEHDAFAAILGLFDEPVREQARRSGVDVRETDARGADARRSPAQARGPRADEVPASTHTGRMRLRPDELARVTDSAPVPIALPGPFAELGIAEPAITEPGIAEPGIAGLGIAAPDAAEAAPAPSSRRDARQTGHSSAREEKTKRRLRAESKAAERDERAEATRVAREQRAETKHAKREQRAAAAEAKRRPHGVEQHGERGGADAGRASSHHGHTRSVRTVSKTHTMRRPAKRRSPLTRLIGKATIMLAAAGLVATTAVPAYAQFDGPLTSATASGKLQTLAVGSVQGDTVNSTEYGAHTLSSALDSTLGTVVAPETQALARQLMTAVAQGRLTGSNPDHIFEIRYLAAGEAVPGCGVDYRVLQAIAFALTQFNTVGISDINRHCTGQIEGAGTASAHYTDGGGHAVDFFLLNGHSLTGGDPDSVKLIEALDAVVPTNSTVGQMNCRASLPLAHFQEIDDTCDHVHVDFLDATGATLLG